MDMATNEWSDNTIMASSVIEKIHDIRITDYQLPSVELLESHDRETIDVPATEIVENKKRLKLALERLGIKTDCVKALAGPAVTRYETTLLPGRKVLKLKELEVNLTLLLKSEILRITIDDLPRPVLAIEIPNVSRKIVPMYELINSVKFRESKAELPLAIGKTVNNKPFIADLAKMPHLLAAGACGQGKTMLLHAIITSLLYKKRPYEVKFVMIDPKRIELSSYASLEEYFFVKMEKGNEAVVTNHQETLHIIDLLCDEMKARTELLRSINVRSFGKYNHISQDMGQEGIFLPFLPYIIVIIDECADIILSKESRRAMSGIARLAQSAHKVGIHLVMTTQNPGVIPSMLKAYFPVRIAFRVISTSDSKKIIDQSGAERLIGQGDMLVAMAGKTTRIQGAWIDPCETERLVQFIAEQPTADKYGISPSPKRV